MGWGWRSWKICQYVCEQNTWGWLLLDYDYHPTHTLNVSRFEVHNLWSGIGLKKRLSKEETLELSFELRVGKFRRLAGREFQTDGATKLEQRSLKRLRFERLSGNLSLIQTLMRT